MDRISGVKPRWYGGLALWAGSDHYSLWQALTAAEFQIPLDRVANVERVNFGIPGLRHSRYVLAYQSERRDCLVVVESLPAGLTGFAQTEMTPFGAAQLFLKMVWSEPLAVLSLLTIPLPIFFVMVLFLFWVNFVLQHQDLLAIFANQSCDAACVKYVLKIHSMVGALFLMPIALVFLPIALMLFQAPKYRAAINYRFAQSYCAVTLAIGIFLMAQLMVLFPYKNYGKFVMSGFGPEAVRFLKNQKLNKKPTFSGNPAAEEPHTH